MGHVVLDVVDLGAYLVGREVFAEGRSEGGYFGAATQTIEDEAPTGALGEDVGGPAKVVGAGLAIDRDVIDVADAAARFFEAIVHGLGGKAGPMFDSAKAFFLGGSDEFSISQEASGGVAVVSVYA